ncbi:alpha/beta hydrolase [Roseospira marina]|uniref:Alpha/beta hydrolase n=1 Tax=Roseospira marina TaxID=140057 RepID=A0A5M6ICF1_9PROT|nr:alpha/beta hydrolase [Roseospira marina]KAA5605954.1 alpha/beta hydrolase [Roseospira marina]MBB4313200.1 pimeloyl-ACP methyl ester carboxylesterase [Roseospira marina]MBB5086059.1 pimeloyl-ACP methyl ester carboxylesterase [Roseospira marina]
MPSSTSCRSLRRAAACLLAVGLLAACAVGASPPERATLEDRARAAGFTRLSIGDPELPLATWLGPEPGRTTVLTVVLEGDGAAWPRPDRPPADPTPRHPVALGLALTVADPPVAYLARPCQYDHPPACRPALWTRDRFSDAVIRATGAALDALKDRTVATRLRLVGYSGGAYIAARLAAVRDDVAALVTVAGVLDPAAWARHHGVSPLPPLDAATVARLATVPQVHWIGARDTVVPPALARAVLARIPGAPAPREVPGFDHACCWVDGWSGSFP